MSNAYTNYLAYFTFRNNSFGNVTGLGTSARTAGAIILGGPRAGAGSAYRIYNYLNDRNPNFLYITKANLREIAQANKYLVTNNSRNYAFGF
jgi:hypothetical protein